MCKLIVIVSRQVNSHEVLAGTLLFLFVINVHILTQVAQSSFFFVDLIDVVKTVVVQGWDDENSCLLEHLDSLIISLRVVEKERHG
jgi:hypothetical protein